MTLRSIHPFNGQILKTFEPFGEGRIVASLEKAAAATPRWGEMPPGERALYLRRIAETLRRRKEELSRLITLEMGKLLKESEAEIEKCAWVCEYFAGKGPEFLENEPVTTDAGKSYVAYQPLGTVLAIMPWNFPFWQFFRFAAPALMGGNTALLKHASNVPQCALAIEEVVREAGLPEGVVQTLLVTAHQVHGIIEDPRIHAVTLTGSEAAGRKVAAVAGAHIKKTVLELGGSDAFIILEDADLDETVKWAVAARFLNAGQSCIAAKRFIPVGPVADAFVEALRREVESLKPGDPLDPSTTLAPMAREDLREELHRQVTESIAKGAVPVTGCAPLPGPGTFYAPSILDHVSPDMPAFDEELFGPVASVIRARDEEHALELANLSRYGLGGSVWTSDETRGERLALRLQCGTAFVNGMVKSDPRLPFGGVKASGYGRELSHHGLREFLNIKSLWIR